MTRIHKRTVQKDLHDSDNHDGVITHPEPDILECEVNWALGSITTNKASEVMEFQLSYFKSKKMTLLKCCTHMPAIWTTQQLPQDWKMSIFIPTPKKGNAKEYSNYRSITFISQSSKAMLKILQARLPQYMN